MLGGWERGRGGNEALLSLLWGMRRIVIQGFVQLPLLLMVMMLLLMMLWLLWLLWLHFLAPPYFLSHHDLLLPSFLSPHLPLLKYCQPSQQTSPLLPRLPLGIIHTKIQQALLHFSVPSVLLSFFSPPSLLLDPTVAMTPVFFQIKQRKCTHRTEPLDGLVVCLEEGQDIARAFRQGQA